MRGSRAFLDVDDGAFDLVACTDAHDGPHEIAGDISVCLCRMKSASPYRWLRLGVRSGQYLAAGGRQLRQGHRRFWLWRLFRRLRVDNGILEPIGQIAGAATVARRWFGLALASDG